MAKSKKHVLNTAKKKIYNELLSEYQNAVAEVGLLSEECSGDDKKDLDRLEKARAKVDEAYKKIEDWKQSPRAKKKKSVTWSSDYESSKRPKRQIVKTAAYNDYKATNPTRGSKPVATWLEEGALVCKRGHKKAMIVLSVNKGSSEILNDGNVEWHRNLSLRPFEAEDDA